MTGFPLPGMGRAVVAAPAPGAGPGYWAGASNAALDTDGTFVVAYRVRNGHDGIDQTVVARSPDGETLTTVATLDQSRFGAQWMERPALVRTERGRWRLYLCCGTPASKHWWIDVLEATTPPGSRRRMPVPPSRVTTAPPSRIRSCGWWTGDGTHGSAVTPWTCPVPRIG